MSYQQFPPAGDPNAAFGGQPPTVQQPATPFAPAPVAGGRKPALIGLGALVLAAGVGSGVVMLMASSSNYDDGVKNLARAPIGCTTTLEFEEAGTFTVYVETVGSVGELRGDCPNTDADYEYDGDDLPDVDIVLVDEDGDEIDLDDDESAEYDAAGAVGQSIASIEIEDAGEYEMTVSSDEEDFVISVGKNPKDTADSLKTNGMIAIAAGVVLGGLLLVLGLRRKPAAAAPGAAPGGGGMGAQPYAAPPQAPVATYPPASPGYAPPTQQLPPTGGPQWPAPPST